IAPPHGLAAVRPGQMHARAAGGCNEFAHLLEPFGCQPALTAATLNGKAVCRLLVRPAELMRALVRMNPELYRRRHARQQTRVENQEAWIGRTVIVQLGIEHRRPLAAIEAPVIEDELADR